MTRDKWAITWGTLVIVVALASGWAAARVAENSTHTAQIHGCERGIEERLRLLEENELTIIGNEAVAADPKQPPRTKRARSAQAQGEKRISAERREEVDPDHGGKLICEDAYPEPSVIPTPW